MKLLAVNLLNINVTSIIHTLSYNKKIENNKYNCKQFIQVYDKIYNIVFDKIIVIRSFLYDSV